MLFIENTYKNSEHSFEAKTVMNGISVKGVLHYKDTVPFVHMGPDFGCIHHEPKESSKADLIGPAKKRAARK